MIEEPKIEKKRSQKDGTILPIDNRFKSPRIKF